MNPPIPPRPDYNSPPPTVPPHKERGPPPAPERTSSHSAVSSSSRSSSRRSGGSSISADPPVPPPPIPTGGGTGPDPEWEAREEVRQQELSEARARAAQMEKTMRWWSDCTANWREKWSKVRNERNKAREECRHLRGKLETCSKKLEEMKEDKSSLSAEVGRLRRQLEAIQGPLADKERASVCSSSGSHKSGVGSDQETQTAEQTPAGGDLGDADTLGPTSVHEDFVSKLLSKKDKDSKDLESSSSGHSERSADKRKQSAAKQVPTEGSPDLDTLAQEKMAKLRRKLEEAHKAVQAEAQEKGRLMNTLKQAEEDLCGMREKYEDLHISRQHALDELAKLRASHQDELGRITTELQDETTSRTDMDKRVAELRKELERLQAENANEWARREQLETDKLALERETKRLRSELDTSTEEVAKLMKQTSATTNSDVKTLHLELESKTKELNDLRHAYSKQKKVLAEVTSELEHTRSRAEQYEVEVRKVRGRVDELKHALATAEDEVDHQTHQTRKLQRSNDELQQQVESLQVQVQHLHTRLRRSSNPLLGTRTSSLKSYGDNDSATDGPSEEEGESKPEVEGE